MNINEENTNELYETLNASVDLRNRYVCDETIEIEEHDSRKTVHTSTNSDKQTELTATDKKGVSPSIDNAQASATNTDANMVKSCVVEDEIEGLLIHELATNLSLIELNSTLGLNATSYLKALSSCKIGEMCSESPERYAIVTAPKSILKEIIKLNNIEYMENH